MQKNLILVSEMGGTYDVLNDRDDTIGITTWFNERYVKDKEDATKLYVDEEIRPVIKLIYKLYIEEGLGRKKICDILNSKYNYPTPSVYYRRKHLQKRDKYHKNTCKNVKKHLNIFAKM